MLCAYECMAATNFLLLSYIPNTQVFWCYFRGGSVGKGLAVQVGVWRTGKTSHHVWNPRSRGQKQADHQSQSMSSKLAGNTVPKYKVEIENKTSNIDL